MDNLEKNANTEDFNSGDGNIGEWNSGSGNSGNFNNGIGNSGSRNLGNFNSGNWNSGDFNSASFAFGCFNTPDMPEQKISLFNKPSNWTHSDWLESGVRYILFKTMALPIEEIAHRDRQHDKLYVCCKTLSKEERFARNVQKWKMLSDNEKRVILELPNFDKEIFKQITGIDVNS